MQAGNIQPDGRHDEGSSGRLCGNATGDQIIVIGFNISDQCDKQAAGGITVEDFHTLLVLARLVAKGHGRSSLLEEDWEKAKSMEVERRARVASLPPRPGANFANGVPMHL